MIFWGDEWAEDEYARDDAASTFDVCELRQYQKKTKSCEEGVWVLWGASMPQDT